MSISEPLIKKLYAKSGNKCAFPGCKNQLIHDVNQSEMAHIISRKPNGPRHIPNYNGGDYDTEENLIVLCKIHHNIIDRQWINYPREMLYEMKAVHENEVQNAVNGLDYNSIFIKNFLDICARNNVAELLSQNLVTAFWDRLFEASTTCETELENLIYSALSVSVDRLILIDIENFKSVLKEVYSEAAIYSHIGEDGVARPKFCNMESKREKRDLVENNINYLICIYNKYRFVQLV